MANAQSFGNGGSSSANSQSGSLHGNPHVGNSPCLHGQGQGQSQATANVQSFGSGGSSSASSQSGSHGCSPFGRPGDVQNYASAAGSQSSGSGEGASSASSAASATTGIVNGVPVASAAAAAAAASAAHGSKSGAPEAYHDNSQFFAPQAYTHYQNAKKNSGISDEEPDNRGANQGKYWKFFTPGARRHYENAKLAREGNSGGLVAYEVSSA